jgi:hypothetical protein
MYLSGSYLGFSSFEYIPFSPLPTGVYNFIDYSAQSNKNYVYYVFPETTNAIGLAMISEPVTPIFYIDSLANVDGTDNVYQFDLGIQSGDYQNTEDFFEYLSYSKYNSYAFGQRQFYELTITAISSANILDNTGSDTGTVQTIDYLESLRCFIQNGKPKYFKDKAGHIFQGITHNYKQKVVDDAICVNNSQPFQITFDFIQTADINTNVINNSDLNNITKLF